MGAFSAVAIAAAVFAVPAMIVASVVLALVPGLPWWLGLLIGAAIGVAVAAVRLRRALAILLTMLDAEPADPADHPRIHNLVEGLSLAGGVAEPELHVVDDDARNAAALAQGPRTAIVVSSGLLDSLDRVALEGVVAEALVRIRSGDAEASTIGAALFAPMLAGPVAAVATPVASHGLRLLLDEERELVADREAVALTRYPPGLLAALDTIRAGSARIGSMTPATEHVWLVPPSAVGADGPAVRATPIDLRIDVLGEL